MTNYPAPKAILSAAMNSSNKEAHDYNTSLMGYVVYLVHLDVSRSTYNLWVMPLIRMLTRLTFWTDSQLVRECTARQFEPVGMILHAFGGDLQKVFDSGETEFVGVFIDGLTIELTTKGLENVAYDITRPFLPTSQLNKTFELFTKVNPVTSAGQMFAFGYISDVLVSNNLSAEAKTHFLTELAKPLLYPKGNQKS